MIAFGAGISNFLAQPGSGGSLLSPVTNTGPVRFFRTRVRLP